MPDGSGANSISSSALDALIAAHDGDVALLYLYLLHTGGSAEQAARALCRTLREITAAEEKLRRMGLLDGPAAPAPTPAPEPKAPPADELPEYRAEDIVRRSQEDPGFSAVVKEAQKVLGHSLSSPDLKRLFGIYDYLALPPEVILELLNHCVCVSQGRRPSMRFIEKEAYVWVNREIYTLEQAEEYIRHWRTRHEASGRIAEALGIRGRALTATEARYVGSWLDMGFDEAAVSVAYDRTVTNTGALKWGYLNKILQSWHDAGIHTVEQIALRDPPRRSAPRPSAPRKEQPPVTMDELKSILEKM